MTFDTPDKDAAEYLVDITDGIGVEDFLSSQLNISQHKQYQSGNQSLGTVTEANGCDCIGEVSTTISFLVQIFQMDLKAHAV